MGEAFLNGRVVLHPGNCLDVLAQFEECSVDSCVTDPPYHLTSIIDRFGASSMARMPGPAAELAGQYKRLSRGFMGKQWDGGDVAFRPETWCAVYRVLKPGAHLIAMGGTRTFHRLACAIEDAGFEIRDTISWLYGSGFPKSHDVSKGIDKAAGVEFEARPASGVGFMGPDRPGGYNRTVNQLSRAGETTDAARQWEGWGTALKPACELIVLARKPLSEPTVAANVLRWGTGAINVDACRVETESPRPGRERRKDAALDATRNTYGTGGSRQIGATMVGRWPANVVHDGSDEVTAAFPDSDSTGGQASLGAFRNGDIYGKGRDEREKRNPGYGDSGSAARFFYTAKADADDRLGSKHPTVKPLDLMQWLVRLVTPKGGMCLDLFAGTGTTAEACYREGFNCVLIEAEPEYQADIRRRVALVLAGPDERSRESIKARNLPRDDGPLFAVLAGDYNATDDFTKSIDEAYRVIRERKANGGEGWEPP